MIKQLAFIFLTLVSSHFLNAQQYEVFDNIDIRQGLPSNNVYHTVQDAQGFVWTYTDEGLAQYNGKIWRPIALPSSITQNKITALHADPQFGVWLITDAKQLYFLSAKNNAVIKFNGAFDDKLQFRKVKQLNIGIVVATATKAIHLEQKAGLIAANTIHKFAKEDAFGYKVDSTEKTI